MNELLRPLSAAYGLAVGLRNRLYDREVLSVRRLPAPVVSVGNLTVGGSGKTPLAALLAQAFIDRGYRTALLSRGYRRRGSGLVLVADGERVLAGPDEAGDEPLELARAVRGLIVAVGSDRYRAGVDLARRFSPRVYVLDDGFQHRRLHRDLDLVCMDASEPVESLALLPGGRLREGLPALGRADALVWTRARAGLPGERLSSLCLPHLRAGAPVLHVSSDVSSFTRLAPGGAESIPADQLRDRPVAVLAAISRPARLTEDLAHTGARIVWSCLRRDHHRWRREEVQSAARQAEREGASVLLVTGKDAVKLEPIGETALPIYRIERTLRVLEPGAWKALLDRLSGPARDGI